MTAISAARAYPLWAKTYDLDPNPLVALEHRVLSERLKLARGDRLLDLATGTGRWLEHALARNVRATGVDVCPEMLAIAAAKRGTRGRLLCADLCALPLRSQSADLAICSFALGYVDRLDDAFREIARVARRIIISDLHPDAVDAGWVRSFRTSEGVHKIHHHNHSRARIESCALAAGLRPLWTLESAFGAPEQILFERAGKANAFPAARQVRAILMHAWESR